MAASSFETHRYAMLLRMRAENKTAGAFAPAVLHFQKRENYLREVSGT